MKLDTVDLLICLVCLGLAQPFAALAQTNASAPLSPAAQEALDYLLAIRFFEEAGILPKLKPIPTRDLLDKVGKPLNGQSR